MGKLSDFDWDHWVTYTFIPIAVSILIVMLMIAAGLGLLWGAVALWRWL